MKTLNISIIDDDSLRPMLIKMNLEYYIDSLDSKSSDFHHYFNGYNIERIPLREQLSEMTDAVLEANPDCVLIDYRLNSEELVDYDGVELAESILGVLRNIPLFILTAYEDDLFRSSTFSAYQVYDVEKMFVNGQPCDDVSKSNTAHDELLKKIVKQAINYRHILSSLTEELKSLLEKNQQERTAADNSRILEIDSFLEHSLDSQHALPAITRQELTSNDFEKLINKIDALLEVYENA